MKDIRIGVRLAIGFGILTAIVAAIALLALNRLNAQAALTRTITDQQYVKAAVTLRISYFATDMGRLARAAAIEGGGQESSATERAYNEDLKQLTAKTALMDRLVVSDEEKRLLEQLKLAQSQFLPFLNEVVALSAQNRSKDAVDLLLGPRRQTQEAYIAALDGMVRSQEEQMAETGVHASEISKQATIAMIVALGAAVVASIALGWIVTRSVTRPLARAVGVAERIAGGDLSVHIGSCSRDEAGQLLEALKAMQASLAGTVGIVRKNAESVANASSEIAQGNLDLSQRTEEQAASLEETAASIEQLTATVRQNADSAQQASQLAISASVAAEKSGSVVRQVVETMEDISVSSGKVAEITSVIEGIAFQTNILALNAAVEAARAGEQGRGFAVVAGEVRTLAQRSAAAAKEVKELIVRSVDKVSEGAALVTEAGTSMQQTVNAVRRVQDIVNEIASASLEQRTGIEQVQLAVSQMDGVTQQNAALVEQASAAAQALSTQANDLRGAVSSFKLNA
ncbi:methyl-accepting chemotaxis protein [Paraburkholderia sp. EG287B]|uniref:methyl-accepting chemotaxis protein n=1 Tax=unclassified Paraburkholderia TaxID=2615204 RepID=UPI0034D27A31